MHRHYRLVLLEYCLTKRESSQCGSQMHQRLSNNLVVMLLLLSHVRSRSRQEATEVDSVVSEIVSSLE